MINILIIFLIRMKLGLKKYEMFRFTNQRSKYDQYYFTKYKLMKLEYDDHLGTYVETRYSSVSLNWLLDSDCKIEKVES